MNNCQSVGLIAAACGQLDALLPTSERKRSVSYGAGNEMLETPCRQLDAFLQDSPETKRNVPNGAGHDVYTAKTCQNGGATKLTNRTQDDVYSIFNRTHL
jgi:hypothetical protein